MGVLPALTSIISRKNFSALLQHKEHMSRALYVGLCDIRIWNRQKGHLFTAPGQWQEIWAIRGAIHWSCAWNGSM